MSLETSTTTTTPAPGATAAAAPAAPAAGSADGDSLSSLLQTELDADEAALLADWTKDKAAALPGAQTPAPGDEPEPEEDADGQDPGADPEAGAGGEPEPQEDNEGDGEDPEDDDGDGDEPEPEATPVQKRINKLTAQKKDLQTRNAALETEIASLKAGGLKPGQPVPLVPMADDPLSHLNTPEAVEARITEAKAAIAWCKAHKNGGQVPKEPGSSEKVELTAEDVEATREAMETLLNEHGPARLKWLESYSQAHALAKQAYPDVFKAGSQDNAFVREMVRHVPGLARHPMHEIFIGDMLAGAAVRTGTHKLVRVTPPAAAGKAAPAPTAAGAKTAAAPRPSLAASAAAPAPRPRGAKPDTSAVMERALKGDIDSGDAVDAMLAAKFG